MKRKLSTLLLLALSATLVPAVYADSECTNATLTGAYSYNDKGWIPSVDKKGHLILANSTLVDLVGVLTADGEGHFSSSFTACLNGSCSAQKVRGTYNVKSDCTGKLKVGIGKNATPWSFAISNGGSQVYAVETDIANVSGTATRQ
jgi:hypothetical protein